MPWRQRSLQRVKQLGAASVLWAKARIPRPAQGEAGGSADPPRAQTKAGVDEERAARVANEIWTWIKADNPLPGPKPPKQKQSPNPPHLQREIRRDLPLRERDPADVGAQIWEWIRGDNPIAPRAPRKQRAQTSKPTPAANPDSTPTPTPAPTPAPTPVQNNQQAKSKKDLTHTIWLWLKGDNPLPPPKPKKQHKAKRPKTRKPKISKIRHKKKPNKKWQIPHRPNLPQIPEQEESGSGISSQLLNPHPGNLNRQLSHGVRPSPGDNEHSDASSEMSFISDGDPPEYNYNHTRPPSYMTAHRTGGLGVHVPGAF